MSPHFEMGVISSGLTPIVRMGVTFEFECEFDLELENTLTRYKVTNTAFDSRCTEE